MIKITKKAKAIVAPPIDSIGAGDVMLAVTDNEAGAENLTQSTPPELLEQLAAVSEVEYALVGELQISAVDGDVVPPAAPAKPARVAGTVMIALPFILESKCYLDVSIDGKKASLFKDSLTGWEIEDGMAMIEMPRALARRRGLLLAA